MSHDTQQLLSDLNQLLRQFETAVHAGTVAPREQASEATEQLREGLKQARARVDDLRQSVQDEFERGVQATDQLVRGQPWVAIGVAAAIAFVLGVVVARRD
jgi:ElaB/YqjD/DUF883 family membrane-anchored ribosome-binding protein